MGATLRQMSLCPQLKGRCTTAEMDEDARLRAALSMLRDPLMCEYAMTVKTRCPDVPDEHVATYALACLVSGGETGEMSDALAMSMLNEVPPDWDDVTGTRAGRLLDRIDSDAELRTAMRDPLWTSAYQWEAAIRQVVDSESQAVNVVHAYLRDEAGLSIAGMEDLALYRHIRTLYDAKRDEKKKTEGAARPHTA